VLVFFAQLADRRRNASHTPQVLWALRVCDGLERKPFMPELSFTDRAYKVLKAAVRYARWGGRTKVGPNKLLMNMIDSEIKGNA